MNRLFILIITLLVLPGCNESKDCCNGLDDETVFAGHLSDDNAEEKNEKERI